MEKDTWTRRKQKKKANLTDTGSQMSHTVKLTGDHYKEIPTINGVAVSIREKFMTGRKISL